MKIKLNMLLEGMVPPLLISSSPEAHLQEIKGPFVVREVGIARKY